MFKNFIVPPKKLFENNTFIFLLTFTVQFILFYLFEYLMLGNNYLIPDIGLTPIAGLVFGPVGALGNALASFIFEIYMGINIFSALADTGIQFFISILSFKLWYSTFLQKPIKTPKFNSRYNIFKFFAIMLIVSIAYWIIINLTVGTFDEFSILYPHLGQANISYFLNMYNFSLIFGLLFVSLFNILKIPMQIPKKWINLFDFRYRDFIFSFTILFIYTFLTEMTNLIDNDILDILFFLMAVITSLLIIFNKFDIDIKREDSNYSVIEEIILFFLIVLFIFTDVVFEDLVLTLSINFSQLSENFLMLSSITFATIFVLVLSIMHISYIEKNITNPLYDLKSSLNAYLKNENSSEDRALMNRIRKYEKNDDDISVLAKSFIMLKDYIWESLSNIERVAGEKERIATEFNIASRIQSQMIKTDFEEFSKDKNIEIHGFMKPAREVGGDFYDYFQIDEDNIGFVIGDVSGKGVPATLFMVKTMYLIRNHSKFKENPNEIFENINNIACQRNDGELFVTSWFGKLNLKTGKLTFVNAGHNPPLIRQNMIENNQNIENNSYNKNENNNSNYNTDAFEYLNIQPNLVLGGLEEIPYEEHELNLKNGDIIFLYTDGITEANTNYQGFYGQDRLRETINKYKDEDLGKILEIIKNDVYEFCKDENQFDDMSMLIIKYTGCENHG